MFFRTATARGKAEQADYAAVCANEDSTEVDNDDGDGDDSDDGNGDKDDECVDNDDKNDDGDDYAVMLTLSSMYFNFSIQ